MRTPCCHSFLSFLLKFLHFLQTFTGISLILYSIYLLNQWNHHNSSPPHPIPAPSPANFEVGLIKFPSLPVLDQVAPLKLFGEVDDGVKFNSVELPAPWYVIYTLSCAIWMFTYMKFRVCIGGFIFEWDNLCMLMNMYIFVISIFILIIFLWILRFWTVELNSECNFRKCYVYIPEVLGFGM